MTKFLKGMARGMAGYSEAPAFILRHKLTGYLILPGIISLVLAIFLLGGAWWLSSCLGEAAANWSGVEIAFLRELIYWSIMAVIVVGSLFLFFFIHKQLVLIALAPFLSNLAAKSLQLEEQQAEKDRGSGAVRDLVRSARVNRRYLTRELLLSLALLVIGLLIPVIGSLFATVSIFLIEAKYVGNGLVDYALELKRFRVKDSYQFARERRGLCAGLGAGYLLLMMIPVVGWVLAPGLGTVAGTLVASRDLKRAGGGAVQSTADPVPDSPPPLLP